MKKIITLGISILVIAGGCNTPSDFAYTEKPDEQNEVQTIEESATTNSQYIEFSEEKYSELKGTKPFALFFHAGWCPTCRQMETEIKEKITELPEDMIILKADFDTETELRKEFGITSQSTVVFINGKGEATETLAAPSVEKMIAAFNNLQ